MRSDERRRTLRSADPPGDCDLRPEVQFGEQRQGVARSDEHWLWPERQPAHSRSRRVAAEVGDVRRAHATRVGYISKVSWTSGTSAAPGDSSPSSSSSLLDHPLTPYLAHSLSKKRARPSRYFSPAYALDP